MVNLKSLSGPYPPCSPAFRSPPQHCADGCPEWHPECDAQCLRAACCKATSTYQIQEIQRRLGRAEFEPLREWIGGEVQDEHVRPFQPPEFSGPRPVSKHLKRRARRGLDFVPLRFSLREVRRYASAGRPSKSGQSCAAFLQTGTEKQCNTVSAWCLSNIGLKAETFRQERGLIEAGTFRHARGLNGHRRGLRPVTP
jgi:hypothetical protein